jgi:hypothetical protein
MGLAAKIGRRIRSLIVRPHVGYEFPAAMLLRERARAKAPPGYEVRQPPHAGDEACIAALLSQEPGFGAWSEQRVRDELLSKLAHPKAATLVLYDGVPVATGFATDESTRRRKIAHGMYLYIVPAHRGRSKLAAFIMYTTLGVCVEAGYDQVLAFTDPTRLSALLLYLSNGARPVKQSLSCWWRWRKIERRLAPALKRAARRQVAHRGLEQDVLF